VDLEHSFSIPVGVDEAWKVLLDYERVARLLPGASLASTAGDELTGAFKVKLGPVNLNYQGRATVIEKDELSHRAVLTATGTDTRNGRGTARVTASLTGDADSTTVLVTTNLELTGKPAQFSHAVMVDVGAKLIGQFADALAADLGSDSAEAPPAAATPPAAAEPAAAEPAAAEAAAAQPADDEPVAETSATPSYSVPDGGVTAEQVAPLFNGRPTAGHDLSDVEPMELIKSAGPALGKKVAGPAAVALVIALIAARRRQRR
jgi:carbon monoxide dehydrogenase subunit G